MIELLLTVAGTSLLCVSMPKHYWQIVDLLAKRFGMRAGAGLTRTGRYALRTAGYAVLAAAVYACIAAVGVGVGLAAFAAYLTIGVFGLALLLSLLPRRRA